MKECLQCQGQFKSKSATVKFCSTNCRVKYHRKHPKPKKEVITELNMKVLYNAVLDLISNHSAELPKDFQNIKQIGVLKSNGEIEPMFPPKPKIRRSYANYIQLKAACENEDEWEILRTEILESDLPISQKATLTT